MYHRYVLILGFLQSLKKRWGDQWSQITKPNPCRYQDHWTTSWLLHQNSGQHFNQDYWVGLPRDNEDKSGNSTLNFLVKLGLIPWSSSSLFKLWNKTKDGFVTCSLSYTKACSRQARRILRLEQQRPQLFTLKRSWFLALQRSAIV